MDSCFIPFRTDIKGIELPQKFTFPFYYQPHKLSIIAAKELQEYLSSQKDWEHNFGLIKNQKGFIIGKMFGVLVVQDQQKNIGYLAAFSGKLANENHHALFVPPVFDILSEDGFFKKEEKILNEFNFQIKQLETNPTFFQLTEDYESSKLNFQTELSEIKVQIKFHKTRRDQQRKENAENVALLENLRKESIKEQYFLKERNKFWKEHLNHLEQKISQFQDQINNLKEIRKEKSARLQEQLFSEYYFLNQAKKSKSLGDIFKNTSEKRPPAGAGECAAPKLLQYAFLNNFQPLAMAEFWWGQSPKSEVRVHQQFYPACRGKCEPILLHMLEGIEVEENPMLSNPASGKEIEIIFEDDFLAVVHKPAEFLSVPGINIKDSVYERMKDRYPNASGPLLVHRLDMSTSGLMLIAKNKESHKQLQSQFIKRKVSKRYVALLEGTLSEKEGLIDLPLRVDLDDRPRQLVCYEHGKPAQTRWKVLEQKDHRTRVHFYPITGRTHQLRVHAAHALGLQAPIVGDDLYGTKANRLHLHADKITFRHPSTNEVLSFEKEADF